jgi:hypothetical protein
MKYLKIAIVLFLAGRFLISCQKEYSVEGANGLLVSTGAWQFNDSTTLYAGDMDSAYIDSSTSTQVLHLVGTSLTGSQNFQMLLYANKFTAGTYKASLFQATFVYSSGGNTLYQANQLIGEFIVNITAISNTIITGTFSGTALNSTNQVTQITSGRFTSTFNQSGTGVSVSSGVLGDSSGNCKPVTISGLYTQGIALDSTNTIQAQVIVATAGTYSISTNSINGVSFSGSGTFLSTGVQTVTLTGTGMPASSGLQNFILKYGNSQCAFSLNFGQQATGNTGGAGGNCTPVTILGNFQQGTPLDASNGVQIQLTVTSPGNYSIVTNSADGFYFYQTGTFTSTGTQTIILAANGTPVNSGSQNFTVTFGSSNCTFSIPVNPGVAPSGDYLPLTMNSNWTFFLQGGTSADSIHTQVINYSPNLGSNTYSTVAEFHLPSAQAFDSLYYRKPGGDYYEYVNFSNYIPFDQSVSGEFIFLKDNVASGTTWNSPTFNGTIGGTPVSGYITMTILAKAVAVNVGTFSFPDVIKMQYDYYIVGNSTPVETDQHWFARNVGEIYRSINNSSTSQVYNITAYQVF